MMMQKEGYTEEMRDKHFGMCHTEWKNNSYLNMTGKYTQKYHQNEKSIEIKYQKCMQLNKLIDMQKAKMAMEAK